MQTWPGGSWLTVAAALAAPLALAVALPTQTAASDDDALRVLFIGNSYTRFNDLPRQVARIAASVPDGPRLRTRRETHGGFDLRRHWRRPRVRRLIQRGRFDAVVIQAHSLSPIRQPDQLAEYARRFHEHARATGARLVLFETWARHPRSPTYRRLGLRDPSEMLARVGAVYGRIGRDLGATVAPVGRAWQRAREELPETELHRPDGTHPNVAGTYLSACVMYQTLTGRDPRDATWRPWRMSEDEAASIRRIAAARP